MHDTIARVATEIGADFIAIGTHGRKGMAHALMGSVAEAVLRASSVPVLLVREGIGIPPRRNPGWREVGRG